ncbi:hypothetical protein NFI96_031537, partial [Prochilodus magdalenae]
VMNMDGSEMTRLNVMVMDVSSVNGVEDMSTLSELHEESILHNLYTRYCTNLIYNYTANSVLWGSVLWGSVLWGSVLWGSVLWAASCGAASCGAASCGAASCGLRPVGQRPVGSILWGSVLLGCVLWGSVLWAASCGAASCWAASCGAASCGQRPVGQRPVGLRPVGQRPVGSVLWGSVLWAASCGAASCTNIGSILAAVNPYKQVSGLYDPVAVELYSRHQLGELPPHIFALANECYRCLWKRQDSQCVLISGESGAGKTESTKLLLKFLSVMSQSSTGAALSERTTRVEQAIIQSSPIMEAFGNAKTVYNNNSSRFGKFIQLHFAQSGNIQGGCIVDYLLEKNRVVRQNPGERNYHIFYSLLSGADREQRGERVTDSMTA